MERTEWTRRWALGGLALAAFVSMIVTLPQRVCADEAAEKKGAALMDKYVEVTGGKAAYEAIKSRSVKGQQVLPNGETGRFESYWADPDKFHTIVELPVETLERGSDGKTVWVSFPSGATIVHGAQRVAALRLSPRERFGRWREIYQKAEYAGDEDVDGTRCSKVVLTFKPIDPKVTESPITVFIAQDSGLIVKWVSTRTDESAGAQASVEVAISVSDYRKVGDIRVPHQMKITVKDESLEVKIDEIVLNAEIPADKFALPDAIKEQLKASKSGKEGKTK
jgi:outer membrane lipoprotein-sorting protein